MQTFTLTEMLDKHIGIIGSPGRDKFEKDLEIDILSIVDDSSSNPPDVELDMFGM